MRRFVPACALLAYPAEALALDSTPGSGFSLLGSIVQMCAALAVVVGIILLFYYVSNRVLGSVKTIGGAPRYIRLIESRFLAPKKSLLLVEVGGEYLLLSSSGDSLQFVKQVDMLEEIEVIDGEGMTRFVPGGLQNKIVDLVSRLPKRNGTSKSAPAQSGNCS